jgi:hypothetical protein
VLWAQYILQIKNRKNGKVYERYYPGHTISFRVKDEPDEIWGKIDSIGRDTFYMKNVPFPLSSIERVTLSPANCNWRSNGVKLMMAGIVYPGIEALNSLDSYDKVMVRPSTFIVGTVLITTGYILYRIGKRSFRMNEKYYLKTL